MFHALGNPLALHLSPGLRHDITQAEGLLEQAQQPYVLNQAQSQELQAVLADKGCDSEAFLVCIARLKAEAVIPSRKNRKQRRDIDEELYKDRNKVERFFNGIKHYRRVATRYDKTAVSYLSFVHVACNMTWLL